MNKTYLNEIREIKNTGVAEAITKMTDIATNMVSIAIPVLRQLFPKVEYVPKVRGNMTSIVFWSELNLLTIRPKGTVSK